MFTLYRINKNVYFVAMIKILAKTHKAIQYTIDGILIFLLNENVLMITALIEL